MDISIIAALSKNYVIGNNNQLPWHLPNELRWFKEQTINKTIIMGRNTYASIGKALPKRKNIILTSDQNFIAPNCLIYSNLENAIEDNSHQSEVMIIGGEKLYNSTISIANRMYLTMINENFDGDTYFPRFNMQEWNIVHKQDCFEKDINYSHLILDKKSQ